MTITIAGLVESFKAKYGVAVRIEKIHDTAIIRYFMEKGGHRALAEVGHRGNALSNAVRTQMIVEQIDYQVRKFAENVGPVSTD